MSINLPSSLTTLGSNSFGRCSKLEEIKLSSSITSIECDTFSECKN